MAPRVHLLAVVLLLLTACASTTRPGAVGVTREQFLLVPAADVERMAAISYAEQINKARAAGRLVTSGPEYDRLSRISGRLVQQAAVFRDDTSHWTWQLTLIDANTLNATCAPGGKITFYTGLMRQLELSDDEIAAIMGHEIAHALREHGREKVSEAMGQDFIIKLALASSQSAELQAKLAKQAAQVLLVLPNSRQMETEADRIGLELMARAGYDPGAAINLWRKMAAAASGQTPMEFLSTHPSYATRSGDLTALQPVVRPYFEQALKQ